MLPAICDDSAWSNAASSKYGMALSYYNLREHMGCLKIGAEEYAPFPVVILFLILQEVLLMFPQQVL